MTTAFEFREDDSIQFDGKRLFIIDQTLLPAQDH